jgi:hypothetical protein
MLTVNEGRRATIRVRSSMRREATRRVSIALALAVAVLVTAGRARAQWPEVPVTVEITATEPGSSMLVRGGGRALPCGDRCVLSLQLRQYRLWISDPEGHGSSTVLDIFEPTSLTVSPANYYEKVHGVGLFVGGIVATAVGVGLLFLAQSMDARAGACHCGELPRWEWYAGGAAMAAGLAVGATGFFKWRRNTQPVVETRPLGPPALPPP